MNLMKLVTDQISNELVQKIGSAAGISAAQTQTALGGAIPALLAALGGMASSGESGAEKVASAVRHFADTSSGSPAGAPHLDPAAASEQGGNLLTSLFGDRTLTGLL